MISSIAQPWFHRSPIRALVRRSTEATGRSISAATMISVSGNAMIAISEMSWRIEFRFCPERKSSPLVVAP